MPENIITQTVTVRANGNTADGYLARPESSGPHPAVIVIQEWWGVDAHIKDVTERFARLGFVAIAPDLYHGQVTAEPDEAKKLLMELEYETAAKEIDGAAAWLESQEFVNGSRFGWVGYCMGGGLVLTTAIRNHNVAGAIVYYGGLPNPVDSLSGIEAPVLAFYGDGEAGTANELERVLTEHNKSVEVHIYEGAAHGFFNDSNEGGYDLASAYDTWPRAVQFFQTNLG